MDSPEQHRTYHSCVLLRTASTQIGEKLPSVVFTKGDELAFDMKVEGILINYSFNAVKYRFAGREIVLSEASFLLPLLSAEEKLLIGQVGQILFQTLNCQGQLQFYLLSQEETLLELEADIFTSDGVLIFRPLSMQTNPKGKELFLDLKEKVKIEGDSFHFESEFALLSSSHFLNCLVRGSSIISEYRTDKNGKFWHYVDQRVLKALFLRYPSAHL